jgi:hypothetical protein
MDAPLHPAFFFGAFSHACHELEIDERKCPFFDSTEGITLFLPKHLCCVRSSSTDIRGGGGHKSCAACPCVVARVWW